RQKIRLTDAGTAIVQSTIVVENTAPVGAPPSQQLGPGDSSTSHPGDYIAWVLLWGPAGSTQDSSVEESGLQLGQTILFVPAGKTQAAAVVDTVIPKAVKNGRL